MKTEKQKERKKEIKRRRRSLRLVEMTGGFCMKGFNKVFPRPIRSGEYGI
jgi:hypothetical protein